jgi:ribosome recycling factor
MDVSDLKGLFAEVKKRMDAQLEHVRRELGGVRTGRASVTILDSVHVDAYGSSMPLNQVASLSIPEPTLIIATPFDPSLMGVIEKAIRNGIRQVRRDANEKLKKLLKDHGISEDDERRGLDDVQKQTDQHILMIDELQKKKDAELLNK